MGNLSINNHDYPSVKPFLKWVGGKSWLFKLIRSIAPTHFNRYFEPFIGGGAIFFSLSNNNESYLSDINYDLINTYEQIKINCDKVIEYLKTFKNTKDYYLKIKSTLTTNKVYNAARFIYLNKTCYNGVYRVNKKGLFNVPYGNHRSVKIYDEAHLVKVKSALQRAKLIVCDFESILEEVRENDLVFIDPPYITTHKNNNFIEYNKKLFTWEDQKRLARSVEKLKSKGAFYIITNAAHEKISLLFEKTGKRIEVERYSTITSKISKRRKVKEFIFTNCI